MSSTPGLSAIIEETRALLRQAANARGMFTVSPEVAALLQQQTPQAAPPPHPPHPPHPAHPAASEQAEQEQAALEALAAVVAGCTRCPLHQGRTQTVFGVGNPRADLVFVGEAPGAEEDRQGKPFVGPAGQLLGRILEKIGLRREEVYICNVIKCRPPMNRNPLPGEVQKCEPFLLRQLELIQPKVICALGKYAAQTLLKSEAGVGQMRGKWHQYNGIPLRVTYHPSYLLRLEGTEREKPEKFKTLDDMLEVKKVLTGEQTPRL